MNKSVPSICAFCDKGFQDHCVNECDVHHRGGKRSSHLDDAHISRFDDW